ncbi:MAG: AAA family ATPase, partial [Armatimonadota bacterium]|nr:AAA family ATPase [Armatimonadota bacterium]
GAAAEVARLRREIKEMGPVNTGAIQEYQRIKERWDFLTEQRTDLENARAQIMEAIKEIDTNTRGMFLQAFADVSTSFQTTFSKLFGGGTAKLALTNPSDILETGIEISVQPPGKKMQDLALLSGGEKALTAAALIFALLMVRPSPLIVLDEVDAPLDESNVERFADLVRSFAVGSQFLVVTHNRATMEAAHSLYGVTMQEPGVSKLVSVRLVSEGSADSTLSTGSEAVGMREA